MKVYDQPNGHFTIFEILMRCNATLRRAYGVTSFSEIASEAPSATDRGLA